MKIINKSKCFVTVETEKRVLSLGKGLKFKVEEGHYKINIKRGYVTSIRKIYAIRSVKGLI